MASLDAEINADLRRLRSRLLVISFCTLVGIALGSYFLVLLGLVPLQQMSHAVSQISEKDFRLNVDQAKLPQELQPIASRLTQMLDQLRRAFDREKQAAADISHELRTPLSALLTTIEVALRRPRKVEEYQEILDECRSSGRHMYQMVERLLALARLDAGVIHFKPREVDLADVAKQCVDMVRPLAEARGLKLRVRLDPPVAFTTDPDKVREVLINLLHNAIEYNRPDGAVELHIGARANGDLRLEVRDTGIGIAPEAKLHLFERFYRADPSRHADTPHAGLGLAIVKSYVDLMGGRIGVDSSDRGSTFFIDLPAPSRA